MEKVLNRFEKTIGYILMIAVMAYIAFQTLELLWESYKSYSERIKATGLDYTQQYGASVFVIFFNILLALEILETVRVFEKDHAVKIRIILLVCIIAISLKILTLDLHQSNPMAEFAIAALILCLSLGYFLINKSHHEAKQIS
jgi:uncharacterized membrane protein (DUF373 family)